MGLMFPAAPWRKRQRAPVALSTRRRMAPTQSGESSVEELAALLRKWPGK